MQLASPPVHTEFWPVPMQAHYDSVQQIVAGTTTPNLLPRLAESLSRNTDYKPLLEALRSAMQASYAHM